MIFTVNKRTLTEPLKVEFDHDVRAEKLSMHIGAQECVLLVSEDYPATFTETASREMFLEKGFHSLSFVTPITGYRLRNATTGEGAIASNIAKVTVRAYG